MSLPTGTPSMMPGKRFLLAVQWHPEFSHKVDENSRKIFRDFVKAAAGDSIFGADGPTSVYIKGVTDREVSPRELEERALFKKKKEEIEKSITPDPHTIDQVIQFIIEKYHGYSLCNFFIIRIDNWSCCSNGRSSANGRSDTD